MRRFLMVLMIGCLCVVPAVRAGAAEIDVLLDKLVEKGLLTPIEAQIVKDDTKEDVARQISGGRMDTLPSWIQTFKFSGDFRTRYQWQEKETGTSASPINRQRARIRFRLNAEAKVNDQIKLKAGLITGDANPRSGNQTLENSFDTGDIRLNYAYVEYTPQNWVTLTGGKIANPLWRTSGMLWSGDITPEGVGAKLKLDMIDGVDTFVNAGFFIIDEGSGYQADPVMWAVQPGMKFNLAKNIDLRTTVNYYGTNGVQGKVLDYSSSTNTRESGKLKYQYDGYGATAELGIKKPFGVDYIPYVSIFGDYIQNPDPSRDNEGWSIGGKLGHARIREAGNWQISYNYRELEKDAWLDILPDESYYSGKTNVKGHQVTFQYGLLKNLSLALNYNRAEQIVGTPLTEDLYQADLSFKF